MLTTLLVILSISSDWILSILLKKAQVATLQSLIIEGHDSRKCLVYMRVPAGVVSKLNN